MQNIKLRIASINHPPYVILNETSTGIWKLTGGIDAYVINILKEKFCFSYEVVLPIEKEWGNLIEGRWTGVIGMVHRNEVDFGISNMMITQSRYESVTFSVPYNSDGWLMVSLAPKINENTEAVVHPFKGEVWCALFMSILISSCLLFSLQVLRSRFKWTPYLSWRNSLWNIVAVLCQEGVKLAKIQGPGLVYLIVWIFSTMILQVSYGGTLIGFLTFPEKEAGIDTLKDLADAIQNKNIKLSLKKYSLAAKIMGSQEHFGEIFTQSLNKNDPCSAVSNNVEGFQGVLSRNFVFVANEFGCIYDSYLVDFKKLQMTSILSRSFVSIVFSRKFMHVKDFNIVLRRLTERGLIYKWRSDILHRRLIETAYKENDTEMEDINVSKEKSLKISQLTGAFVLLIGGHAFAGCTLLAEIAHEKYRQTKRKNKNYPTIKWTKY